MAPRKRLGQHFLRDRRVLARIVSALELEAQDRVVEIGAGNGVLTRELAGRVDHLMAIELDHALAGRLHAEFADHDKVEIVHADALELDPCDLLRHDPQLRNPAYKLAGNIPYYITGALMRRYLDTACKPSLAVLMVQLEVAERMLARPGDMNLLAINVQLYADPSIVIKVPPSAFSPAPKVDSAMVKLRVLDQPRVPIVDSKLFFTVIRSGFSTRRKQLVNSLANGLKMPKPEARHLLEEAGIRPEQRAEELGLQDWSRLTESLDATALTGAS